MRRGKQKKKVNKRAMDKHLMGFYMILFIMLVMTIYFYYRFIIDDAKDEGLLEVPASAEYSIKRTETISVSRTPVDYKFKLYEPPQIPDKDSSSPGSIQNMVGLELNPMPKRNPSQGTAMIWEKDNFLGTDTISITYTVKAQTVKWDLDTAKSGNIDDITDENVKKQYLGNQWAEDANGDGEPEDGNNDRSPDSYKIEPSNPQISSKAQEIAGDGRNVYETVSKIYRFITRDGGFTYSLGREGSPSKALNTLNSREGDCDDQSILFISMLRSLEIPAWLEIGLLYDPAKDMWFGHAWTNVYIPLSGGGYEVVAVDVVNEQFLFRTCNHLTDWTDDGTRGHYGNDGKWNKCNLADYYYFFSYHYASQRKPKVQHLEEFSTISYMSEGSVLYDSETGESRSGDEIPFIDLPAIIITVTAIMAISHRRRKNKRDPHVKHRK